MVSIGMNQTIKALLIIGGIFVVGMFAAGAIQRLLIG